MRGVERGEWQRRDTRGAAAAKAASIATERSLDGSSGRGGRSFAHNRSGHRLAHLQSASQERLSCFQVALVLQQHTKVGHADERIRVALANRLTHRRHRLAQQRLRPLQVTFVLEEHARGGD